VKRYLLVAFVLACTKPDDVPALREEAHATVAYYNDQLDQLDTRFQTLVRNGQKIDRVLPGGDEVGLLVVTTSNGFRELRKELEAADADIQSASTIDQLRTRIEHYRDLAEDGHGSGADHPAVPSVAEVGAVLGVAESWLAHAETEMAASGSGSAIMSR
jgi:hypothetical protein